jgi:hypothetical protein
MRTALLTHSVLRLRVVHLNRLGLLAATVWAALAAPALAQVVIVPPPPVYIPGYVFYAPAFPPLAFPPPPYGGYFTQTPPPIINPYFAGTPYYMSYYPAPIVNSYLRPHGVYSFTIRVPRQPRPEREQQEPPPPPRRYPRTSVARVYVVE